ncbi:MAG: hypothetical protein IPO67_00935 [Deltaproteobacteria bacterium]|nr:hypothetical protein [Deltaproteobacteria bacterium]MBK9643718.1 hypothetical protein [Deltaproteobacteria bacterium]
MTIYRWDLDKTYLETDFHSWRGLYRSATEPAHEKRNVPGSASLLRALASERGAKVVIVSGSPTQLREVLTEKLRLDGVRFDELHLKDNLGNLKRGRFRAIKGQFGYKLPLLLQGRVGLGSGNREMLFGDDAEVDALVYSVFADVVAGRLRAAELSRIMEAAGAYPDAISTALATLPQIATGDVVDRIFIHLDRGMPPAHFAELGGRVVPVYSWFQAALVLVEAGRLTPQSALTVGEELLKARALTVTALANHVQDLLRRRLVSPSIGPRLEAAADEALADLAASCAVRAAWLGPIEGVAPPLRPAHIDYLSLLGRFGKKEEG